MATWPTNSPRNPAQVRVEEGIYTELRVMNMLLCRMSTLLSQLVGPPVPLVAPGSSAGQWTPEDLSGELDQWRKDPENSFN